MTTLERARKFFEHIHYWCGYPPKRCPSFLDSDETLYYSALQYWLQARVARALIRQEMEEAKKMADKTMEQWDNGFVFGMDAALDILDAVYGRRGHD